MIIGMKRLLILFGISLFFVGVSAQNIKFLKGTEQHWVGGVCCSYGTNYIMYLESSDTVNFIHIDTVWIGDKFFVEGGQNRLDLFKNVRKGITTYRITALSSWSNKNDSDLKIVEETKGPKPPHYKGKACLIYYSGKQRKFIPVPEFMKLNTVNYP